MQFGRISSREHNGSQSFMSMGNITKRESKSKIPGLIMVADGFGEKQSTEEIKPGVLKVVRRT